MSGSTRRTIPALVDDPRAVHLTLAQRHTLALLPLALDDHGRTLDDPGRINGLLWGSLWREHGPDALDDDLAALAGAALITRYVVDDVRYLQMLDWDSQQVISRRSPSRYPAPPTGTRSNAPGSAPRGFGRGFGGGFSVPNVPDAVWESVDGLVDAVAGATEKLHDPAVQSRAVSFLADLAGQLDPDLAVKVRERAGEWLGSVAYGESGRTSSWTQATEDEGVHLTVVKDDEPGGRPGEESTAAADATPDAPATAAPDAPATAAPDAPADVPAETADADAPEGSTPQDTP